MVDGRHLGVIFVGTISKPKPNFHILNSYAILKFLTCLHGSKVPFSEYNFSAARERGGEMKINKEFWRIVNIFQLLRKSVVHYRRCTF